MRSSALPHPGSQISTREQYSTATPSFRRVSEHPRSPPFSSALARHPLSPSPSPITGYTSSARMDQYTNKGPSTVPPLSPVHTLGNLQYANGTAGGIPVKVDIQGNIDKGFFQAEGEWTCYRRNYFSCVCSYTLNPPHLMNQPIQYVQSGSQQVYDVMSFAMCISAVVSDNESHTIDLVQHTPKRDKGPTAKPEKVRMLPKTSPASHHNLGVYNHDPAGMGTTPRMPYHGDSYPTAPNVPDVYQTEHTFERIQFKQATANNGKRRAAQQYYHLVIELWADVGNQSPENFIKVAYRKSAKMIVRGRSPGHYQNERRGSTSSGPGGSAGSMSGYQGGQLMNSEFPPPSNTMLGSNYASGYESSRGVSYQGTRHELPVELPIPAEEAKNIDTTREYQYFPGPIYEGRQHDNRGGIDMFSHQGGAGESAGSHSHSTPAIKKDPDNSALPSLFQMSQRCGPFEPKMSTMGYYPTMPVPSSGMNIT